MTNKTGTQNIAETDRVAEAEGNEAWCILQLVGALCHRRRYMCHGFLILQHRVKVRNKEANNHNAAIGVGVMNEWGSRLCKKVDHYLSSQNHLNRM